MKNINIVIIILFILLSFNLKTKAQEDTVIIEKSTESIKESDFKQKRKYKYLDNNFREEKTIIKLGTLPLDFFNNPLDILYFFQSFNISLSVEKKINPQFSFLLDNGIRNVRYSNTGYSQYYIDLGVRYYYSMNKRLQLLTGANNFHANYLSLKIENLTKYAAIEEIVDHGTYISYSVDHKDWTFEPSLNLAWGMQRRVGKRAYFDIGPYVKFNANDFGAGLNLYLGLGWGFKR